MASPSAATALLLGLAAVLSGCMAGDAPSGPPDANTFFTPAQEVRSVLGALALPDVDVGAVVDLWEAFVEANPKRDYALPDNPAGAQFLRDELVDRGIDAEIHMVTSQPLVPIDWEFRVVRGIVPGADPTKRIALVSHYDTAETTYQGAYDPAAGTIANVALCDLLNQRRQQLQFTVECLLFDGEEQGLRASRAWLDQVANDPTTDFEYVMAFGYDMTGINWPGHEWDLYAWVGTDTDELADLTAPFVDLLTIVLHDHLEDEILPGARDGISVMDSYQRASDEVAFRNIGVPVVRFSGGEAAGDYPFYHTPLDTVDGLYLFVGGRANFEHGMHSLLVASYYTILAFDAFGPRDLPTA